MRLGLRMGMAKEITAWAAVIIGGITEWILVAMIDRLPTWAQWLVYGTGVLGVLAGFVVIVRDRNRARRRRAAKRDAA